MMSVLSDVRRAVRSLLKTPAMTLLVVGISALAIGAVTAIFSVVNGVLLRPLPYAGAGGLVWVYEENPRWGRSRVPVSAPNYLDWRAQNSVFEDMAAVAGADFTLTGTLAGPQRLKGAAITASTLPLLRVQPIIGRNFTPQEQQYPNRHVVLLGHGLWQRAFGGDPGVVGRRVVLNTEPHTVVGVMPPGFAFPNPEAELWSPLAFNEGALTNRNQHSYDVIARLKAGITLADAEAGMKLLARRLEQQYPEANSGSTVSLLPMRERLVGDVRLPLVVLLGAVGFLLLIGCANVANLLLVRGARRRREMAVRTALGAGRWALVRQVLTESVMLAAAGGAAGTLLAVWGVDLLLAAAPRDLPGAAAVGVDGSVLLFAIGLSVLTGVVFGAAPAAQALRTNVSEALKAGGRGSSGGPRTGARSLLVAGEVALSLVLLVGAGLMVRSFAALRAVDAGFRPDNVLTMELALPDAKYPDTPARAAFITAALERVRALPGVRSAGAAFGLPLSGMDAFIRVEVDGGPPPAPGEPQHAGCRQVSGDYFSTMGTRLVRGRDFDGRDAESAAPKVIVNEAFVRRFFKDGGDPIGRRITIGDDGPNPAEVVGVVADVRHASLDAEAAPEMYRPYTQNCWGFVALVVRADSEPAALTRAVAAEVASLDPDQPVHNVRTMEQVVGESVARRRLSAVLLAAFAAAALVLAAAGIYGVVSYSVSQRTHEIGIRMAVGARPADVVRMVLRQGLGWTAAGICAGLLLSLALTRVLRSQLFEVSPLDPATFLAVPVLLSAVALVACRVPARRATRVDPAVVLRQD